MHDRDKVISEFEDFVKSFSKRDDTYYKGLFVSVLAMLKEQKTKPVEVCGQMYTVKYGHCPKCGKGIDSDAYPQWCGFCGQAVKWE